MKVYKLFYIFIFLPFLIGYSQEAKLSNMFRLAQTFEQSGEFEQAKSIYEDLFKSQPNNPTYLEALNNIYILLKDYDKSIQLLTNIVSSKPQNVNYYGMLGNTYYTKGDTTKAFETWEKGLDISRGNTAVYRAIINYTLQNRAFNKAIEYLNQAKNSGSDTYVFSLDLARVYAMTMNFEKAAFEYCEIIKNDPTLVQMVIGNMSAFLTRPTALTESISSVKSYYTQNNIPELNSLLIHLYKMNGDYKSAFEHVVKLEEESNKNGREFFQFAQQALIEKKFDVASMSFEKLIEEFPKSPLVPSSRIGYAKAFEQSIISKRDSTIENWKPFSNAEVVFTDDFIKAINSYKTILELYPNDDIKGEALYRIGEIYHYYLDNPDSAKSYYKQVIGSRTFAQIIHSANIRIAEIELRNGENESATSRLETIAKSSNISEQYKSEASLLLGKLHFWNGQFKQASSSLSSVTKNLLDDNANDALQIQTLIGTLKSDSANLATYSKAEYHSFNKKFDEAAELYDQLRNGSNPILKELAGLKYAYVLIAQDRYTAALEILKKTKETSTIKMFEPEIEYISGEIKLFAIKDYEGAQTAYRNILDNYSNSLYFDKSRQKIEFINELKNKTI